MDTRQAKRLAVSRKMMVRLAHRDFRARLRADGLTGERTVIVLLRDDTVGLMCEKVRDSSGPSVVVVEGADEHSVNILQLVARDGADSDGPPSALVNVNSTVGMLLQMRHVIGSSGFAFGLTEDGTTTVAMTARGEKIEV